jgi:hypothetical protein
MFARPSRKFIFILTLNGRVAVQVVGFEHLVAVEATLVVHAVATRN